MHHKENQGIHCPTTHREYLDYIAPLALELEQKAVVRDILLEDPAISSTQIMSLLGISKEELIETYKLLQQDKEFQLAVNSPFYSRKIMFNIARTIVRDLDSDPEYVERMLSGQPISPRVVELHTTKGSCNYNCVMCLWSDKQNKTYSSVDMEEGGLLNKEQWEQTLASIKDLGARYAVFSGGGEVLLNRDFFGLLDFSKKVGLKTQLYTSGYNLSNLTDQQWSSLLNMDRIRFSIHSPIKQTYNKIVDMPDVSHALPNVTNNLQELLLKRNQNNEKLKVGIGFVIQPLNVSQVEEMVLFAQNLGVDFLNIRRDEILVTNPQLITIRSKFLSGQYGNMEVDFSDNLTAFMNEEEYSLNKTDQCFMKFLRPAVTPFGQWTPCDLMAEPMYSNQDFVLGNLHADSVEKILVNAQETKVPASCPSCMPSGQTGNAILSKLLEDYSQGIDFREQPFY
jgi:MoaA/NifB/PqqE/SkfB family radical SAM enzyme